LLTHVIYSYYLKISIDKKFKKKVKKSEDKEKFNVVL